MITQKNPFTLKDKFILITGASSGIGRQCAIVCSQMGASVALFGRNLERLGDTLQLMEARDKHLICGVDLLDYNKVAGIVRDLVSQIGRINGLINCAGISTTLPFQAISSQKMELFFNTNVISSINLTKHVVKLSNFSSVGGSIIFISSVMALAGESGKTLYSMTKGALNASVKSLAIELAQRNIRVNTISPGVVETPMSQNAVYSLSEDKLNRIKSLHPLGFGKPEDVAYSCVFLLSDTARWITGSNLTVDGGYLAR